MPCTRPWALLLFVGLLTGATRSATASEPQAADAATEAALQELEQAWAGPADHHLAWDVVHRRGGIERVEGVLELRAAGDAADAVLSLEGVAGLYVALRGHTLYLRRPDAVALHFDLRAVARAEDEARRAWSDLPEAVRARIPRPAFAVHPGMAFAPSGDPEAPFSLLCSLQLGTRPAADWLDACRARGLRLQPGGAQDAVVFGGPDETITIDRATGAMVTWRIAVPAARREVRLVPRSARRTAVQWEALRLDSLAESRWDAAQEAHFVADHFETRCEELLAALLDPTHLLVDEPALHPALRSLVVPYARRCFALRAAHPAPRYMTGEVAERPTLATPADLRARIVALGRRRGADHAAVARLADQVVAALQER
jgi:hypothetical protein